MMFFILGWWWVMVVKGRGDKDLLGAALEAAAFNDCIPSVSIFFVAATGGRSRFCNESGLIIRQRADLQLISKRRVKVSSFIAQHIHKIADQLATSCDNCGARIFLILLNVLPCGEFMGALGVTRSDLIAGHAVFYSIEGHAHFDGAIRANEAHPARIVADHNVVKDTSAAVRTRAGTIRSGSHGGVVCVRVVLCQHWRWQTEESDDVGGGECVHIGVVVGCKGRVED